MKDIRNKGMIAAACMSAALAAIFAVAVPAYGQDQASPSTTAEPDNSSNNKQQHTTADQQTNKAADSELTAQIRKEVVADNTLSMYAHNIKIITIGGMVTLKGPVRSDAERQAVEDIAIKAAGADKVTNKITVKQ